MTDVVIVTEDVVTVMATPPLPVDTARTFRRSSDEFFSRDATSTTIVAKQSLLSNYGKDGKDQDYLRKRLPFLSVSLLPSAPFSPL